MSKSAPPTPSSPSDAAPSEAPLVNRKADSRPGSAADVREPADVAREPAETIGDLPPPKTVEITEIDGRYLVIGGRTDPRAAHSLPVAGTSISLSSLDGRGVWVTLRHGGSAFPFGPLEPARAAQLADQLFGYMGPRVIAALGAGLAPVVAGSVLERLAAGVAPDMPALRVTASGALGGLGVDVAPQGLHAVRVEWQAGAQRAILVLYRTGSWVLQGGAAGAPLAAAQAAKVAVALGWPASPGSEAGGR